MKTQDFIQKYLYETDGKERICSSVFTDGNGKFYSYGYHYPLVTRRGNKFFINDQGYSVSTAKHIGWAFAACHPHDHPYDASFSRDGSIKDAILREIEHIKEKLANLSSRAFRQRENAEHRLARLEMSLNNIQ